MQFERATALFVRFVYRYLKYFLHIGVVAFIDQTFKQFYVCVSVDISILKLYVFIFLEREFEDLSFEVKGFWLW